jgi:hypothetical protein
MTKTYITDIIKKEEIEKWKPGDRVLICSMVGSGKSSLIKNQLYDYVKSIDKKILLMSNRNLLKQQNVLEIGNKKDYITLHNYQEFESRILKENNTIEKLFEPYQYIIFDEVHYFFSDSFFNNNTDLLINPIKNTPKDKIFIFMTATPDALLDYQFDYKFIYNLPRDYSYIENIYFYEKKHESLVEKSVIQNIPYDEKILCFGNSAENMWNLSNEFSNTAFICSPGNKMAMNSNTNEMNNIINNAKFDSHILFSTKILDNGVNLRDKKLKHIIIDIIDPISFVQTLGRKRCISEDDKINLYVRNYNRGMIYWMVRGYNSKIELVKDLQHLSKEEFQNKYPKRIRDSVINESYTINKAKYQQYITQVRLLEEIMNYKGGYKKYICDLLLFDINKIKDANVEFEKLSIIDLLKKNIGIKMFEKDRLFFIDSFYRKIFTPKQTDYSAMGIRATNSIIEEDGLNFKIYSSQETKGTMRNKTFWIIEEKE